MVLLVQGCFAMQTMLLLWDTKDLGEALVLQQAYSSRAPMHTHHANTTRYHVQDVQDAKEESQHQSANKLISPIVLMTQVSAFLLLP